MNGAWGVVLMHDYLAGRDFSLQELTFDSLMTSVSQENIEHYQLFFSNNFDDIDFSRQSLVKNKKQSVCSFSLASILVKPLQLLDVELTEKEKSWLLNHTDLRLGNDFSTPPFNFLDDDGNFSGMGFGFSNMIFEELGVEFVSVVEESWGEVLKKLKMSALMLSPCCLYFKKAKIC